jgi:hypothetical protein
MSALHAMNEDTSKTALGARCWFLPSFVGHMASSSSPWQAGAMGLPPRTRHCTARRHSRSRVLAGASAIRRRRLAGARACRRTAAGTRSRYALQQTLVLALIAACLLPRSLALATARPLALVLAAAQPQTLVHAFVAGACCRARSRSCSPPHGRRR